LSAGAEAAAPSPLLVACRERLAEAARAGPVLDLACGRGRNALAAASWGIPIIAIDRNPGFLQELRAAALRDHLPVQGVRFDLEQGQGIPVRAGSCAAILVFRFLYRPLAAAIEQALAPGGLLLYETFTLNQRELGHGPSRAAFLLSPGELPTLFPGLRVELTWEGRETGGARPEAVARLAARKP